MRMSDLLIMKVYPILLSVGALSGGGGLLRQSIFVCLFKASQLLKESISPVGANCFCFRADAVLKGICYPNRKAIFSSAVFEENV